MCFVAQSFITCYIRYVFVCVCSNAQSRTTTSKGTVRCHFHVMIVKSEFNFKPDKDALILRCSIDELGGWDDTTHVMSVEK